jgi:hypothetical protein
MLFSLVDDFRAFKILVSFLKYVIGSFGQLGLHFFSSFPLCLVCLLVLYDLTLALVYDL